MKLNILYFLLGGVASLVLPVQADTITASTSQELQVALKKARSGDTIALFSNTYEGKIRVPSGVSLVGTGLGKTILKPTSSIRLADGTRIARMTIVSNGFAIRANKATDVTISSVYISGTPSSVAIDLFAVTRFRVENCAVNNCMTAINANGALGGVIVNCTIKETTGAAISMVKCEDLTLFNNLICDSRKACLQIVSKHVIADHNVYSPTFNGEVNESQLTTLDEWRTFTEQDAHSAVLPVTLKGVQVRTRLEWHSGRACTSIWGSESLNGIEAPQRDALGRSRPERWAVGALNPPSSKKIESTGTFYVAIGSEPVSAYILNEGGFIVHNIFNNLPLAAGTYEYALPKEVAATLSTPAYRFTLTQGAPPTEVHNAPVLAARAGEDRPQVQKEKPLLNECEVSKTEERQENVIETRERMIREVQIAMRRIKESEAKEFREKNRQICESRKISESRKNTSSKRKSRRRRGRRRCSSLFGFIDDFFNGLGRIFGGR